MIEILSGISLFLGYILKLSAQFAIIGLAVYGLIRLVTDSTHKERKDGISQTDGL